MPGAGCAAVGCRRLGDWRAGVWVEHAGMQCAEVECMGSRWPFFAVKVRRGGKYVLIPSTEAAGLEGSFMLECYSGTHT